MITLDASAAIAVLSRVDPHHERAAVLLATGAPVAMHTVTLAEVLVGGVRIGRGPEMRARLDDLGVVELTRVEEEALALARLRVETRLKLPDCCAVLAAEHAGAVLATFDARLAEVARSRGIEVLDGNG